MKPRFLSFPLLPLLCVGFAAASGLRAANGSSFLSQDVPASLVTGEVRTVSITFRNTGTTTWTEAAQVRLGTQNPQDNTLWTGATRVLLPGATSVGPNQPYTFTFDITAPGAPGTYNFQWRMLREGVEWFGAFTPNVAISVTAPPAQGSRFVSQSVPASLAAGQTIPVSITFRNSGTSSWTSGAGYKLGSQNPQDNVTWGAGRVALGGTPIAFNGTKTFSFNVTAPAVPGTYNFQWRMLQEGVAWFGDFTPNVALVVTPAPIALCPGVTVVADGASNAAPGIQTCINNAPSGGTLNLPAGTYGVGTAITINKPFTLRTQGLAGSPANCEAPGISCAVLKALPSFNAGTRGFLAVDGTSFVTIDHLVLDGNRAARLGTAAAAQCAAANNTWGPNGHLDSCSNCSFTNGVSKNALCGTGLGFSGANATITNNVIRGNGQNSVTNMWADGVTGDASDGATIRDNTFIDNSDVALILGGSRNALIQNNTITQPTQRAFAALMLNNFTPGSPADFSGTIVTGNSIDCGAVRNCDFGIQLGAHPWDASLPTLLGGRVNGNSVVSARQGIDVDGMGTTGAPLLLYGNTVSNPAPSPGSFLGCSHATSLININTGDSVVDRNGDATPITTGVWHNCH